MFSNQRFSLLRRVAVIKRDSWHVALRTLISSWRNKKVIVLGDMILDEFILGTTNRVSREAPVVIVKYDESLYGLGGAANAVQNIAALGGNPVAIGVIGTDDSGRRMKQLFRAKGVAAQGLVSAPSRTTTTKVRVLAGDYHAQRQQIVRIDKEQDIPLTVHEEDRVISAFKGELGKTDTVILSDYHQSVFSDRIISESIHLCRRRGVPVVADSRFRLKKFRGVTTATPNEVEAAAAVGWELAGDEAVTRIGRKLLKALAASSLLVTRGRYGMALFEPGKRVQTVDVIGSTEATDVTGAGDTVAASVALTLAAGGDMSAAMRIANIAASIVVMKRGTAVAEADEIDELVRMLP
jgi:rfaE bifunctional protein kinase chain/domain